MIVTRFGVIPSQITGLYLAQDSDFSGTANGDFQYIGTETELEIPSTIKGVAVTSYYDMFHATNGYKVTKVKSTNSNITNMQQMFTNSSATTLDLSSFDTSNVINMNGMFAYVDATTLDLSSFDMSNVTDTGYMFYGCAATTGYARTQADADILNASSGIPSTLTFVVKGE